MTPAYIVHLDDSPYLLAEARKLLSSIECQLTSLTNVADASRYLKDYLLNASNRQDKILFIVDVYLEGDYGDLLSHNFIREHLVPNNIKYIRLTSAPDSVPTDVKGLGVLDKRNIDELPYFILGL